MSLKRILAEYEQERLQRQQALKQRTQAAYALCPELEKLQQQRQEAICSLAKPAAPQERAAAAERVRKILGDLDQKQAALLRELGLPSDHLMLQYRCEVCRDTGYVGDGVRTPCACLVRRQLQEAAALTGADQTQRFETFDTAIFPEENQQRQMLNAKKLLEAYAAAFPDTKTRDLVLMGKPGLGKTFLINCLANRLLDLGVTGVRKTTAYQLTASILQGIREGTDPSSLYIKAPLLLIDDLGTEPLIQNVTVESLFSILNERQNAGLHTVVATNLHPPAIQERYGERVASRLLDARSTAILHLQGENLRLTL